MAKFSILVGRKAPDGVQSAQTSVLAREQSSRWCMKRFGPRPTILKNAGVYILPFTTILG